MLDPGWGSSAFPWKCDGFFGGSLSSGSEWSLPNDHLVSGERGRVPPWMAEGDFRTLSLKQPMVVRPGARNTARGVPSLWS